ncbi:MAG: ABC transporter ATP-binding protein, partial [Microvirga sp.]
LREGRLAEAGSPQDLYLRPRSRETALFLGDAIILSAQAHDRWVQCALGRLPAAPGARRGAVEVMLRPEQIRLGPVGSPRDDGPAGEVPGEVLGEVLGVAFGGASCLVSLRLVATSVPGGAPDAVLTIRSPGSGLPPVGSLVRIAVTGPAHVLDA